MNKVRKLFSKSYLVLDGIPLNIHYVCDTFIYILIPQTERIIVENKFSFETYLSFCNATT